MHKPIGPPDGGSLRRLQVCCVIKKTIADAARKRRQIKTNQSGADVAGVKRDHHINVVRKTAPVFQVDRPKLEGEVG